MKTESAGAGIFRGLRSALTGRKSHTPMEAAPATDMARAQIVVEVAPGDESGRIQFLNVKNSGKEAIFHAKGQIVSSENTNSALAGVYPLAWGPDRDAWMAIPKDGTRQILIATVREIYAGSLFHVALIQAGPSAERHWARWNAQENLPLPRFGIRVSISAEGAEESWTGYFSIAPDTQKEVGVRVTFRGRQPAVAMH
jgi:hypothetical protein